MFGQRVAPGIMVFALGTGLGVPADATTILANYGIRPPPLHGADVDQRHHLSRHRGASRSPTRTRSPGSSRTAGTSSTRTASPSARASSRSSPPRSARRMPASDGAGPVLLTIDGGVAELVLNRPDKMNAMNLAMVRDLAEALDQAEADGARALLVRGEGRAFCSGRDLADADPAARGRRGDPSRHLQPAGRAAWRPCGADHRRGAGRMSRHRPRSRARVRHRLRRRRRADRIAVRAHRRRPRQRRARGVRLADRAAPRARARLHGPAAVRA